MQMCRYIYKVILQLSMHLSFTLVMFYYIVLFPCFAMLLHCITLNAFCHFYLRMYLSFLNCVCQFCTTYTETQRNIHTVYRNVYKTRRLIVFNAALQQNLSNSGSFLLIFKSRLGCAFKKGKKVPSFSTRGPQGKDRDLRSLTDQT